MTVTAMDGALRPYAGPAVAMPIGGLGTGTISVAADGSLTQWEIHNQIDHQAQVPGTGFALRVSSIEPPDDVRRWLRARPGSASDGSPLVAPNVSDHRPAPWPTLPEGWAPVESSRFAAAYPFATVDLDDEALPLDVRMEVSNPFVPLDVAASSLPVLVTTFRITNRSDHRRHGWLLGTLLDTVGWDGITPIHGTTCGVLGGATIRAVRGERDVRLLLDGPDDVEPPRQRGSQALWTDAPAIAFPQAADLADVLRWVGTLSLTEPTQNGTWDDATLRRATRLARPTMAGPSGPSPAGRTWIGGLAAAFSLAPGETQTVTFAQTWWFPDRRIDFDQFGPARPAPANDWLGNAYARPFADASAVLDGWLAQWEASDALSRAWATAWQDADLPDPIVELLTAQPAGVRSPVIFVTDDGDTFGFEGGLGESTLNWNGETGGSCPLNCTHVWNYEQALAALFPSLERTMRDIEWQRVQGPDGSLPHRVRLPLDEPQFHGVPIGGPLEPAIDGMLGAVLKTYREARISGDRAWLATTWPHVTQLLEHVRHGWADGDGILRGRQPVTFDIDLTGPNLYVGSLWVAALRAAVAIGDLLGESAAVRSYGDLADSASHAYDRLLWNGEYYGQPATGADFDFGDGCLTDQLVGQWWAHLLDLGHLFPVDHVRTALRSIVRSNLRTGFRDHVHQERAFADGGDAGVLVCTWPRGGRPAVPVRYADEVWSGSEYQLAAHCAVEGLVDESLAVVRAARARQNGTRRNPFNEIECGDHYVRALSGWSHLPAWTGWSADALTGMIRLRSGAGRYPFLTGDAWGVVAPEGQTIAIHVRWGAMRVKTIEMDGQVCAPTSAARDADGWLTVPAGSSLVLPRV